MVRRVSGAAMVRKRAPWRRSAASTSAGSTESRASKIGQSESGAFPPTPEFAKQALCIYEGNCKEGKLVGHESLRRRHLASLAAALNGLEAASLDVQAARHMTRWSVRTRGESI